MRVEPPPPPPPPPALRPDLVITEFFYSSVTVRNQGAAISGPFRLRAGNAGVSRFLSFPSLAPGQSTTQAITGLSCGSAYTALADDLAQVTESDELNNTAPSGPALC